MSRGVILLCPGLETPDFVRAGVGGKLKVRGFFKCPGGINRMSRGLNYPSRGLDYPSRGSICMSRGSTELVQGLKICPRG